MIPYNWGGNKDNYFSKEDKEKQRDKTCIKCGHRILYKGITHVYCTNELCQNYPVVHLDKAKEDKKDDDDEMETIEVG